MKVPCENCGKEFEKVIMHPSIVCCSNKCYRQLEEKVTKKK